jgi:chaperonin cofactor prefoldin
MNKLRTLLACALPLALLSLALPARGEMYKYVDEKGRVTYSNKPIKGGHKVDLPELSTMPAPRLPPPAAAKPENKDRETRRQALQAQIAEEEQALAEAKQAYQEGSEKPEVWRRTKTVIGKDGKPTTVTETGRNVAAYEEKMKRLQAEVDAHQAKLDQLRANLAALDQAAPAARTEDTK